MDLSTILIISSVVLFCLFRKTTTKRFCVDSLKKINNAINIPFFQFLVFVLGFYYAGNYAMESALLLDRLHNVSTYTPFLGDLGNMIDMVNQMGLLPEIERSESTIELITVASGVYKVINISCIFIIIFVLLEFYGIYRLGKISKKQMKILYGCISIILFICSIFLGIFFNKYDELLSSINANKYYLNIIYPVATILFVSIAYYYYSKALDFLFATIENQTSETKESSKPSDENQAISQSSTPHENQASAHPKKRSIVPYIVLGIGCIIFITIMIISFNKRSNNDDREHPTANIENPDGSNSNYTQESEFKEENEYYNEDTITEEKPEVEFIEENDNYTYNIYENARYKFRIKYPSFFSDVSESGSGDGCTFKKDDKTYLIAYGSFKDFNEPLEDQYNKYKAKSPTYCQLKDNWLVVSDYTDDGCIYYLKTVLKDDIFVSAYIQYPIDEKDFYSTIISEIFPVFPN